MQQLKKKEVATHLKEKGLEEILENVVEDTGEAAQLLKSKATEYYDEAEEKLEKLGHKLERKLRENPVRTLLVGFSILAGIEGRSYLVSVGGSRGDVVPLPLPFPPVPPGPGHPVVHAIDTITSPDAAPSRRSHSIRRICPEH